MSAISSSFLPPSNRRRCVKGRPSYAEPIDFLLSSSANQEHNDDFSQNEYDFMDPVVPDEVEEDITIDLSAFLNENPLLAQSAFESAAENNVASIECSSQFRVTDCEIKPSEIPEPGGIELGSVGVTGTTTENKNTVVDNIVPPVFIDTASATCDSAKENCISPEKIFTKINNSPTKDIAINGKKSPLKKFPRARPLGLSNPLKKYKNFMKSKDLNKVNEKFFGKYPIVKCEKLDIENLVKNNKIKVSNWPLLVQDSQNNKLVNKNNKKLGVTKTLKPKFMRKPISFNKGSKNSNKSNNNIHSILIDKLDTVSRPIIIKTDTWKPGIRNSNPVPTFFKSFISNPSSPSKTAVYDLLKPNGNNQIITFNSSPEKRVEKAVFTHTNKIFNHTKSYKFIAPKLHTPDIVSLTPQYSKPVTESLIEPVADNYTVIEPYIEDTFVPQKPKPILTVPIEVLSSPEKLSSSTCPDLIIKDANSKTVENKHVAKSVFPKKFSVFRSASDEVDQQLNNSLQGKKVISVAKKSGFAARRINRENILNRKHTNAYSIKEKAESSKEDSSILKAKNVVVDAMQNAFSSLQQKKKHKPVKKDYFNSSYSSMLSLDTSSYSSILNDNLLHGFTDADFEDVSISTESNTSSTYDMLPPPIESSSKIWNNSFKKRKSISENSPYASDTLSASECEVEKADNKKSLGFKEASTKRRKRLALSTSGPVCESKNEMLETSDCVSNDIVPTEILDDQNDNKISLKHVESSLSLSNIENPVLKFNDAKNDVHIPSENNKLETHDTSLDEPLNIHSTPNKKNCTVSDNLTKHETCTRTLRGRKSSSTEVDKTSENSIRQNPHNNNAVEKPKFKSIFAKLKIQMKTPPRSTAKVKIKRKSCSKPEDIIREINTITGGRVVSKVNIKKHKKQNSEMNKISDSSDINIKEDSESNSLHFKSNRHSSRSLSRRKALKVCIKKSKKKNSTPRLKMKLSSLPDEVENATSENSLSDNNMNVHSSFREREVCSIGTLQTKGNSAETGTEISDSKMEAQEEKSTPEEPIPVSQEPMVKSSEYFENSCTSDLNNSVSDSSLLIKCNDDESLPNDSLIASEVILTNGQELNVNDGEKSNISYTDILDNVIDNTTETENISIPIEGSSNEINGKAVASDAQLFIRDNEEHASMNVSNNVHKPIDDNSNSDNLVKETNSTSEMESDFDDGDHYEVNDISTDSNVFDNNLADSFNKIEGNVTDVSDVPLMKISENCATVIEEKITLIKDSEIESSAVHDEIDMDVSDNLKDTQMPHIEGPKSSVSEFINVETTNNVTDTDDRYLSSIDESENSALESVNIQEVMIDGCSDTNEKEVGVPCVETPESSSESKLPNNVTDIPESLNDVINNDSLNLESACSEINSCSPRKGQVIDEQKSKQPSNVCDIPESLNDVIEDDSLSLESPSSETNSCSHKKEQVIDEQKSKQTSNVCDISESLNDVVKNDSLSLESPSSETNSCSPRKEQVIDERKSKQPSNVPNTSERLNDAIKDDSQSLESPSSETNSCSPRKEDVTSERKSKRKRQKKCPKIKISFKKPDGKSPESLKNWFISESKKSDESDDVPEKDSENIISDSLSPCNGIESVPNTSQDSIVEHKISAPLSHDKQLSDLNEISLEKMTEKKTEDSFSDDNSQVNTELTPKEKSVEENNSHEDDVSKSNLDAKESSKNPSSDKNQLDSDNKISSNNPAAENYFDSSITIKEEPIDYDENLMTSLCTMESALKKKRGRPRKSSIISASKTSNKKIKNKEEIETGTPKPSPTLNKDKQKYDTLSTEDIKPSISEIQLASKTSTPHSGGRKKKITTPGSNASSNRKKNYDPELVIVPLLKGWSREHVIRSTAGQSDIYYHAPDGKKLRSMPEISAYLAKHTDMKLSAQHFTFAKELVYRTPFEHERYAHARTPIPKTVTPNNIKISNSLSSNAINVSKGSLKDRSDLPSSTSGSNTKQNKLVDVKPSVSSSKKKTLKRRSSSLKALDVCTIENENSSVPPIKIKQERIDNYFIKENQTSRSSRKIIKKVPFDNSFENMFPKRPKLLSKSQESSTLKNVSGSLPSEKPKSSKEVIKENDKLSSRSSKVNLPSTTNSCEIPVSKPIPENSSKSTSGQPIPKRTKVQASLVKKMPKEKFKKHAQLLMAKPCTKFCNFASVLVPTIQCSICLCLFHRECIPFKPIGLTRYACVPCVGMRLTPSSAEEIVPTSDFNIDIEQFYPHIDLQITTDLEFNATFNKFYSPVDPSFLTSQDSLNVSHTQLPQNPGPQHTFYNWNNGTFNPPPHYDSSLPKTFAPISFNPRNYRLIRAAPRFQGTPVSNLNVYGTMPLQKFTNAYFVPNQFPNSVTNNRPRNATMFPTGKDAIPGYSNTSLTSNVFVPQGKNAVVCQVPRHNLLADKFLVFTQQNSTVQSDVSQSNTSVLKSILESVSGLAGTSNVSSTSVLPDINASAESDQKMVQLSVDVKQENNNLDTADTASISALKTDSLTNVSNSEKSDLNKRTVDDVHNEDSLDKNFIKIESVASLSVLETDSNVSISRNNDSNKRTVDNVHNDDELDKNAKKHKNDQSTEIKKMSDVSEHVQKSVVQKNRDSTTVRNINKFSQIYECLNLIFKYLSIPDLLRASLVCHSWNHLATQKLLWEDACFSGISVKDWKKCCFTLQKYGTRRLDLRGISNQDSISVWESFSKNITKLCEVEELIFDKVPPFVINKIADTLPQLRRLICYCVTTVFTEPEIWSTPCVFELSTLRFLGRLEILKISSMGGINTINRQKSLMPYIPNLTHLVLTGFKFSSYMNLECLIQMQQLVTLELGDCMEIEPQMYGILGKLTTLENLCLQNGGHIDCKKMPDAIFSMKKLKTLELMNYKISAHLPNVLKEMDSLLHLSLWPDNRAEAAQVHFNSFEAAMSCRNLKSLCWGILTDDDEQDDTVPDALELTDSSGKESRTLSVQELFQSLVERYPGKKVELKSLPRSAWSEYCSSRSYV